LKLVSVTTNPPVARPVIAWLSASQAGIPAIQNRAAARVVTTAKTETSRDGSFDRSPD
jgi:hypothetical protein